MNPSSKIEVKSATILNGRSLYIFGPRDKFRLFITKIVFNKYFDPFILFLIVFSTVLLAIDNPLDDP